MKSIAEVSTEFSISTDTLQYYENMLLYFKNVIIPFQQENKF
jgi:DNA-binding transcriptional MerR regulator